jgi:cytochrome b6-f complex iron-sulfur subunit
MNLITKKLENNTIDGVAIDGITIDRKEFMRQVGIGFGAIMLMNCLQSCGDGGEIPDPNPTTTTKLDFTIDLKTADYGGLKTKGGFVVVKAQSVIVAHTNADTWIAVDSKCTHEQTTINYRAASNDFLCPNHASVFTAAGAVTTGPATKALTKYYTSYDATNNTLRVFA